jgi:hypothetical protein
MTRWLSFAILPILGAVSLNAAAAPHLTPQQCHSYPFVQTRHTATHAELMQELGELNAAGYEPYNDNEYPANLEAAQQRLNAEYRQDCLPQRTAAESHGAVADLD